MSPKTKEQFKEIRQLSMQTIMQAALELFGHIGYQGTSISKIAKEAGVSKGLIYNYFESKEDLLKQIILDAIDKGAHIMDHAMHDFEEPNEQLRVLLESTIDMVKSNLHYWKMMTALAFQADAIKPFAKILDKKSKEAIESCVNLFTKKGVEDPFKEALLFAAATDGMMLHYMHMGEEYSLEEMKEFILQRFTKTT